MMTKPDIISNAIDQLIEKFHVNPESFQVAKNNDVESIMWTTQINANAKLISDPTSYSRTIVLTYSSSNRCIGLRIYNEVFRFLSSVEGMRPDGFVESSRKLEYYLTPAKKFRKLMKMIEEDKSKKETKDLVNKLSSIFPTMLDHFILGK